MARFKTIGAHILSLAFLGACLFAGGGLHDLTGLPVPGAVLGLVLALGAIAAFRRIPKALNDTSTFLLRHLNLFFVPAGVGLMAHGALVWEDFWPIFAALIVSTLAGLTAAALVFKWAVGRSREHGQ